MRLRRALTDTSNPYSLSEAVFRQYFRLSRDAVRSLVDDIFVELDGPSHSTVRVIPPHIQVLAALQFYGHGSLYNIIDLALLMPMSQASVARCIRDVTSAIIKCLGHRIAFPSSDEQIQQRKSDFRAKTGFPGAIGCVGSTHIAIISPPINSLHNPAPLFFNVNAYYSINVQIVCDANYEILHIDTKYAGSVKESAIWQISEVRELMKRRFESGDSGTWLIGDQGYPIEPWLMTPVTGVTENESPAARYNLAIRNAHFLTEQCERYLKTVFRCLHVHRCLHLTPRKAGKIMTACTILHNIRVLRKELSVVDLDDEDEEQILCRICNVGRLGETTRRNLIMSDFL